MFYFELILVIIYPLKHIKQYNDFDISAAPDRRGIWVNINTVGRVPVCDKYMYDHHLIKYTR